MPPPNVTGALHNGHTLFVTLEDVMMRWHRMLGDPSLWVPGRDHAGIAGQLVVERDLKAKGIDRHDLGREKFLDLMWEWMESYGLQIQKQLRNLGASADWSRDMFTMDPHHVRAVRTAFVRLFDKGLIYRGHRIANWCKDCQTVLSDLEVEYREVQGQLTYVRYPVLDAEGEWITVATTRPETILGDVGVAVNPKDPRYTRLVGKQVRIPHVNRIGVIVADSAVDPEFGTGAVKITPSHDPTDFEIAQRHTLPSVNVMNLDGTMNEAAGGYAGLPILEARKRILQELEANGQLVKQEPYTHNVGHCQRSGTVLEPLLLDQWYLSIKPLADPALAAVRDGRIRIIPERYERVYFNWMENIRDWCISRQLWWGHRIPIYYCDEGPNSCGNLWASIDEPTSCPKCGGTPRQDPDVLDTWFSSGLWPFSTLGWPDETPDLRRFYPTSVMETGHDILFFWVARMIMFGLEFTGQPPFHTVYLHGLIRAEGGVKMSKVKGNVQDPLELIGEYGTDALRLGVAIGITPGNDFTLTPNILDARRDFVNKLWNIGRLVMSRTTAHERRHAQEVAVPRDGAPLVERWIASRLSRVTAEVTRLLGEFNFGEAGRVIHDFIWDEVADWYVEAYKVLSGTGEADGALLAQVYEKTLRLLHPFAPYVTEELWQRLTTGTAERPISIMLAEWPKAASVTDAAAESDWADIMALTRAARALRTEYRIEPATAVHASIAAPTPQAAEFWRNNADLVGSLPGTRLKPISVVEVSNGAARELAESSIAAVAGGAELLIPAAGLFDVQTERKRAEAELADAEKHVRRLEGRLAGDFSRKAPPDIVELERQRLAEQRTRLEALQRRLQTLRRLDA